MDTLTKETLHVDLTPDQKKQLKKELAGLDDADAMTADAANAKLDAILKLLEGHRKTLEAAGYNWPEVAVAPAPKVVLPPAPAPGAPPTPPPGGPPGPPMGAPPPTPNSFKAGPNADHLKSLRNVLG